MYIKKKKRKKKRTTTMWPMLHTNNNIIGVRFFITNAKKNQQNKIE